MEQVHFDKRINSGERFTIEFDNRAITRVVNREGVIGDGKLNMIGLAQKDQLTVGIRIFGLEDFGQGRRLEGWTGRKAPFENHHLEPVLALREKLHRPGLENWNMFFEN